MKRVLVSLAGGAVALALGLFVFSLFLPDRATAERSIRIQATPAKIWPLIADFRRFQLWSPWARRDPEMKVTYDGAPGAIGHTARWTSDHREVGDGQMMIAQVDAPRYLMTDLDFGENGVAVARFNLTPAGDATDVTWAFSTSLNGPVERWFGLLLDDMVGSDYETGLRALKELAEE